MGDFARSLPELIHAAEAYEGWNFYVAPNPCSPSGGVRHSTQHVTHWSWFLLDMDPQILDDYDASAALEPALLWFGEWMGRDFTKNRPFILDSGRGCQAWFRLIDFRLHPEEAKNASRVMRYWLHRLKEKVGQVSGCCVDPSTSDLPRVMRCPGTKNMKTGRMARILHDNRHVFRGLSELMVTGTPIEVLMEPEPTGTCEGLPWQYAMSHVTIKARTFCLEGWQEPGRHEAMWHTVKKMQEVGIIKAEAEKAVRHGNSLCRNGMGQISPLHEKDVRHALDSVYGRVLESSLVIDS